ncbi:MAG: RhoGEF domain-containing protein, partial [Bdellovibrionia bacterium]
KAGPLKQAPLSPKVPLVPVKANFARLDKRYERIENILNEIGETEAVFSEALALLLDLKIENLSLSESLSKSGVVDKKSKKTLDRSVSVLRRILQVSQNFQEGYSSLLVTNGPSSSSMDAIEDFLIQAMSSSEFQSSFSDYAFELLELNQIIIKIEAKKKGKKIHSQYIQEFNKELVQNSRRLCFINMGSVLILPIQRALKYELFVKELIKAKKEFDSIDRLSVLQEIIQDFASQTNQKLSPT